MKKDVLSVLDELRADPRFLSGITAWHKIPEREGRIRPSQKIYTRSLRKRLRPKA
jgi:hypothetical protein